MIELISVHIPKTGGKSFGSILSQVYGDDQIYFDYEEQSRPRVYQPKEIPSEFRVIQGHFPISKYEQYFPDAKKIVWLRHPVYLLISLYCYWLGLESVHPQTAGIVKKVKNNMQIDEFVDQPEVRNILCQNIAGKPLEEFYFVGIQEFFSEDLAELKTKLGWGQYTLPYENINPLRNYQEVLQNVFSNLKLMKKLVENNLEDIELYNEALALRAKRRKEPFFLQKIRSEGNRLYNLLSSQQVIQEPRVIDKEGVSKLNDDNEKLIIKQWDRTFVCQGKNLYYNRIQYNNPSERAVEVPIGFDFLANVPNSARVLEVGNVLSYYENSLSQHTGVISRKIVDKFEIELGVDNEDLMLLSSEEKYDAIVCISTVEHIGQGVTPVGTYGEVAQERDLEAPLKAIAKIYDLLTTGGTALITVPFGNLTDGEWYIQFSGQYLSLLEKYGIPKEAVTTNFLKLVDRDPTKDSVRMLWEEVDAIEVSNVEYNHPFPTANAIAIIKLFKVSNDFHLNLNVEPTTMFYNMPHQTRLDFKQIQLQFQQTQDELNKSKLQLQQTQGELNQSQAQIQQTHALLAQSQLQLQQTQGELNQSQDELSQSQAQFQQTQGELSQSQAQFQQTQGELNQSQAQLQQTQALLAQSQLQLHETQAELEQSHLQLHETQAELEQSHLQLYETQAELEQSHLQLHETQAELEQSQGQLYETQAELEQSHLQLHETQAELEQSQGQLYETQAELERSHLQLHETQAELKQLRFQQSIVRNKNVQDQTHYTLLLWEGWSAYHKGDLKAMAQFLKQSLNATPFSHTETVLNWLETFARFSSESGINLDTNSLVNSEEWKELMRRRINSKHSLVLR
ncbi:hypothetical protein [Kamptonema sp. UHCC 0994]|uniref:hypothetical protein n=1 Tax=Kamptonema sp. UHCC 0994 TaxID=3031329 RepID=UPI0023B92055|nr:hypothetical protein [Kamptonema sp. UHCC 0994]MDF0552047.1 hypothetical protein [Kamptonema sp. UHCC 0994]